MNVALLLFVILGILILGGGGTFLVFWLNRPRRQTWNARVWQLGEGVRPPIKNSKGQIISDIKKQDLKPFMQDILQKKDIAPGVTRYELVKMGKPTPAVTNDVVDYWGPKNKWIDCLILNDSITLLRKGYDKESGEVLFDPLTYDRKMMLSTEMTMRKDRLEEKKGLLEKLALYITIVVLILGMVAVSYFQGDSAIKVSENNLEAAKLYQTKWPNANGNNPVDDRPIKQEQPPLIDAAG